MSEQMVPVPCDVCYGKGMVEVSAWSYTHGIEYPVKSVSCGEDECADGKKMLPKSEAVALGLYGEEE